MPPVMPPAVTRLLLPGLPDTLPNLRLPESSLLFDARKDEPAWTEPGIDVSAWSAPMTSGVPPAAQWGPLTARLIPLWKDYGLLDFPSVSKPLPARGGTITARLPYNAQINPWIKINAPADREIDIRTDNFMGGSQPNIHVKYVTRDGIQEFEAPGWMNGHKVIFTDSSFAARVTCPPGSEGLIGVPRPADGTPNITIDGKPATPESSTARHHLFPIPTGTSRIVAEW